MHPLFALSRLSRPVALMACVLWASAGSAQNSEPASPAPPTTVEQRTERLTQQDAGSRIEELRVGGQTRRISVETPTAVPGYEVTPAEQTTGQAGRSSWRLLRF